MVYVSVNYLLDSVKRMFRRYFKLQDSSTKAFGVSLESGYDEYYPDRKPQNKLIVHFFQECYLEISLPYFLKHAVVELPDGKRRTYSSVFGFKFTSDSLIVKYGTQTYGSKQKLDCLKAFVYPWVEKRTTMLGIIDFSKTPPKGEFFYKYDDDDFWQKYTETRNKAVGHTFVVRDYDGETANAKAIVEVHGTATGFWGKYSFLFFLRRVSVESTLIVTFDKYLGNQKHSFKGGSSSISLIMKKDETYKEAIKRLFANPYACSREFTRLEMLQPQELNSSIDDDKQTKETDHEQTHR